ncbi:clsA, partial [Symbiodinium microadriaticum]
MNLVDPRYFKQDSGVGQWVDAMVRVEGCAVANLAATMLGDWILESGQSVEALIEQAKLEAVAPTGDTVMQVLPSGPGEFGDTLLQLVLATINSAQSTLTMTTPYLVPDESLLRAIRGAASRGVKVQLIVPEKVDSLLTRYASRSYFVDLLECGVEVYLYRRGLLHTKSIVADQSVAMFGTVNLDMRSLWLNYELALFVYDASFATQLFELQQTYVANSDRLDPDTWSQRSVKERFLENTFRLESVMALHSKNTVRELLDDDIYASNDLSVQVPKYKFPADEKDPRHVYSVVHDELMLDGNSRQNLATFCQTWVEPEVHKLMDECLDKNMVDKDEYPQTAEIEA